MKLDTLLQWSDEGKIWSPDAGKGEKIALTDVTGGYPGLGLTIDMIAATVDLEPGRRDVAFCGFRIVDAAYWRDRLTAESLPPSSRKLVERAVLLTDSKWLILDNEIAMKLRDDADTVELMSIVRSSIAERTVSDWDASAVLFLPIKR